MLLSDYLKHCTSNSQLDIPFLFKVLSVNTALSIQAHPDKQLATELNKKSPEIYKDANHKPEMAIALTPFEALYGFLPPKELLQNLESNPGFRILIDEEHLSAFKKELAEGRTPKRELQLIFNDLFNFGTPERLAEVIQTLLTDIKKIPEKDRTNHQNLSLKLFAEYGNDVGILISFLMNYVLLNPGQSLKIKANELHAYISGDCIECMATSDNVVRCGLTPKYKDTLTLSKVF